MLLAFSSHQHAKGEPSKIQVLSLHASMSPRHTSNFDNPQHFYGFLPWTLQARLRQLQLQVVSSLGSGIPIPMNWNYLRQGDFWGPRNRATRTRQMQKCSGCHAKRQRHHRGGCQNCKCGFLGTRGPCLDPKTITGTWHTKGKIWSLTICTYVWLLSSGKGSSYTLGHSEV